ncbi:hypothetical protein LTR15_011240 [Elasticomyces elasticus]|nr:hypothetical protein LTR15_011240 [Elasticomyces elasticus]
MPSPAKESARIETRRLSTASRVHDAEVEPLLRRESQATLYRTISRISEQEPLPPDDTDIELAKTTTTTSGTSRSVYMTLSVLLLEVFISQADQSLVLAPPIILAIFLVQWQLHLTPKQDNQKRSKWDKLRQIDFVGAFFLVLTI